MSLSGEEMVLPKPLHFKRFFSSVFTKLILVNLIAWFLIILAVVFTFFFSMKGTRGPFYRNASQYLQYILEDIGSPPHRHKALSLLQTTGIHISFISKEDKWSTRDTFPDIGSMRFRSLHGSDTVEVARGHGHRLLRLQTDDGTLYFEFAGAREDDFHQELGHLLLIVLLSAILLGCYLALKRVLLPLKWLGNGVAEVANGNLSHRVPVRGYDELAELADSFNEMTARLKKMMETREHLLRDISHELRSPLTRMKVALELPGNNASLAAELKRDIDEMGSMVTAILESAREHHDQNKQDLQELDLNSLLREVTEKYASIPPGVTYSAPAKQLLCKADPNSLRTVFQNLIDNGIKFSAKTDKAVAVGLRQTKNTLLVTVTDYGCGIDPEELPFIFEPFYRIDRSRSRRTGGFGLGLSLCKAIVETHGGRIEVTSTLKQGTQVSLVLPRL